MSKIVTVAYLLAKAMVREKASYLFVVMAAAVMLLSLGLGGINIGSEYKLFEDVLLTSQGYLFLVAALFYSFWLLGRNSSLGLFILPLSAGMERQEYLGALMGALGMMIGLLFALFSLMDALMLFVVEGEWHLPIFGQLFLYGLASLLAAFLAVAFSQYVSLTNSMLYALAFFLIGNALDELYIYSAEGEWVYGAGLLYYLLPNFSFFDRQGVVVNRADFEWMSDVMLPFVYFILWSGIAFFAAWYRFKKKALVLGR